MFSFRSSSTYQKTFWRYTLCYYFCGKVYTMDHTFPVLRRPQTKQRPHNSKAHTQTCLEEPWHLTRDLGIRQHFTLRERMANIQALVPHWNPGKSCFLPNRGSFCLVGILGRASGPTEVKRTQVDGYLAADDWHSEV